MSRRRGRSRLTDKSTVVLLAVLGAAVLLVSGGRTWVTGTVDDAVLGASRIEGTGSEVASGVIALALAAGAAALVTATSGAVVRRVTVVLLGLAGLGLGFYVVRVLLDPGAALGAVAARATGRTGTIETSASVTVWAWVAAGAVLLLLLSGACALVGARRWSGLSSRYDAPEADGVAPAAGSRGERVASDWERLTAGEDPTEGPDAGRT